MWTVKFLSSGPTQPIWRSFKNRAEEEVRAIARSMERKYHWRLVSMVKEY